MVKFVVEFFRFIFSTNQSLLFSSIACLLKTDK